MNMRQQNGQGGHGNNHGRHRGRNGGGGGNRHGGGGNRHSGGGSSNGGSGRGQVPLRNQVFDSHGPEGVRVRGNAVQVWEKYMTLAREAGERDEAESLYQHAEHYYRIVQAIQEVEAEQRARFAPDPASTDQPAVEGDNTAPADPFAMVQPASSTESDTGLTDLKPAAAQ